MERLSHHSHHVDKRLRFRLRIYFAISFILILVILYDIVTSKLPLIYALVGILAGIGVGIVSVRMFHISWNKDAKKIVSRLDEYGIVVLVLYIIFEIKREQIVGYFVGGTIVGTVSFSVLTGIMFGRFLGTRGKIVKILEEQKII